MKTAQEIIDTIFKELLVHCFDNDASTEHVLTDAKPNTVKYLQRELDAHEKEKIYGFYEDTHPHYYQGPQQSEIQELATAKEINGLVAKIKEREEENAKLAAWQCIHTDGKTGLTSDERGNQFCAKDKTPRVPSEPYVSRVDISDGMYLTIDGYYHVHKSRLDTHGKIIGWLAHLKEKEWFAKDARLILDCIGAAKALTGLKTEWS